MSWALEAIEKEAMARAFKAPPPEITVYGLSVQQIGALALRFHRERGINPVNLTPEEIRNL